MNANRRVAYPKSSPDYGTYAWHYAWSVDIACRAITHTSGLVFDFQPRDNTLRPPFGGACPASAWSGELRGGAASVPRGMKEHVAERLCLEALQLFGNMAWFACMDCPEDTQGGDYYMVHKELWEQVHPSYFGMLCLPCLESRVGRGLQMSDFTTAPINYHPRIAEFCGEVGTPPGKSTVNAVMRSTYHYEDRREDILDQLGDNVGAWTFRIWLWSMRVIAKKRSSPRKSD